MSRRASTWNGGLFLPTPALLVHQVTPTQRLVKAWRPFVIGILLPMGLGSRVQRGTQEPGNWPRRPVQRDAGEVLFVGALDVSIGTIEREWRFIKAWLQVELRG